MSDIPLFCECGNRLGLRRDDENWISVHRGRILQFKYPEILVTCEDCQRTTRFDRLLDTKLS